MKNLTHLGLVLIAFALVLSSACKKKDGVINLNGNCNASWQVDGIDYTSEDMAGCLYLDSTLHLSTNLTGGNFILQVDPIASPGNYVVDATDPDLTVVLLLTLSDGRQLGIKTGSVTVELSSSKAEGTFSGKFFDIQDLNQDPVFSVTRGEFKAKF